VLVGLADPEPEGVEEPEAGAELPLPAVVDAGATEVIVTPTVSQN